METKLLTTKDELKALEAVSALTWEGMSTEQENLDAIEEWLHTYKVDTSKAVFNVIQGSTMNQVYKLKGDNAYKNDLIILAITGIDTMKIAIPRFQVGGRWFDDIVDNNARRRA